MTELYDPARARILWGDGSAQSEARRLVPGDFVPVLTAGSRGDVIVPYSQPEHARVYFDGTTLFAQSMIPEDPVYIEGEPIGCTWTQVPFPCVLKLGNGRLVYEPLLRNESPYAWQSKWEEHTVVTDLSRLLPRACHALEPAPNSKVDGNGPTPRRSPALSLVPRQGDALETQTGMDPAGDVDPGAAVGEVRTGAHSRQSDGEPHGLSDAHAANTLVPATSGLTSFAHTADPATVAGSCPNSAAVRHLLACMAAERPSAEGAEPSLDGKHGDGTRRSRLRALGVSIRARAVDDFRRSGRSSRIVLLGLPLICYMSLSPDVGSGPSASDARRPSARSGSTPATEPVGMSSSSNTLDVQPATRTGNGPPVRPASAKQPRKIRASDQPTLQARAADAADRGAYAQAAGLYDQLALRHPDQPEFVSAARIFRARANENTESP